MSRGIKTNFGSLLAAQVWHRGCLLLIAVWLARGIGSEPLGRFLSALSFVWLFWVLIDAGLSELFIRDVATRRDLFASYAADLVRLKGWLAAAALGLMGIVVWAYAPMRSERALVMLLGLALIAESYATIFRMVFRIQERMHLEALLWATDGLLKLGAVGVALRRSSDVDPVLAVGIGWFAVSFAGCVLAAWAVRPWWPSRTSTSRVQAWPILLRRGIPLILIYGLSLMNLRGMIVLVGLVHGHTEAGYFGACERIIEALLLVPMTLAQTILPVSARLATQALNQLRDVTRRIQLNLLGCGLLMAMALSFLGGWLIRRVYGPAFQPAEDLMRVLGWLPLPLFLKPIGEKILCGLHRQAVVWRWYLLVTLGAVAAAVVAVPLYGLKGAAWCLLTAELVSAGGLLMMLWWLLWATEPVQVRQAWTAEELSHLLTPHEASV